MKTISQILKAAQDGDILTDGVRFWLLRRGNHVDPVAYPIISPVDRIIPKRGGFELWQKCAFEKVAVIPNLRIMEYDK